MGKKEKGVKESYRCSCDKEFKYESEKIRHELSHSTLLECKVCHKTFNFASALKRHEKQHYRNGKVRCKECSRTFRDDALLRRHVKYSHKGSYTCAKCLSIFPSEQALHTHEKTHRPQSERQYRCHYEGCGKSFNFPHHLKHHELTHSDTKQHFCNVCGKGFIQLSHLKSHLKSHMPDKWLVCTIARCQKRFATDYALKRHVATHKLKLRTKFSSEQASNGAVGVEDREDCTLCPLCGELIPSKKMAKHSIKCTKPNPESISANKADCTVVLTKEDLTDETHVLTNEIKVLKDAETCDNKVDFKQTIIEDNVVVNSCKTALGGCLASEKPNGSCVCDQINDHGASDYNEQLAMMIPETAKSEITTTFEDLHSYKPMGNQCDNCACSATCAEVYKNSRQEACSKFKEIKEISTMPAIEYRRDGVIKLSETFDKSIELSYAPESNVPQNHAELNAEVPAPYSCKAVLGNCIVSGNDTIGEGCFCARMGSEAQLATAEEIDEIAIFDGTWSN